jgi:hypothetical protein
MPAKSQKTGLKKYSILLIAFICIIAASIFVFKNERAYATYLYLFKYEHFSPGDKLYYRFAKGLKGSSDVFKLYRSIRPINEHDIDSMETDPETRAKIKLTIDHTLQPYLIESPDELTIPAPGSFIGNYITHEIKRVRFHGGLMGFDNMYSLSPNTNNLKIDTYSLNYPDLPKGYVWADNIYYLPGIIFSKEPVK